MMIMCSFPAQVTSLSGHDVFLSPTKNSVIKGRLGTFGYRVIEPAI